jgi:hypothetical protein
MVNFAPAPGDSRAEIVAMAQEFLAKRSLPVALHVSVVGDTIAPFMTGPDTDPAALRAADSLVILPADPSAAAEQIHRCREEVGATYVVIGSNAADMLAPVVARLSG